MTDVHHGFRDSAEILSRDEECGAQEIVRTKATGRQITLNLVTGGFGVGLFSLPWSTAGASIIPATVMILIVILLNAWTISILVEAAEKYQAFDLGALLSKLPGRLSKIAQPVVNCAICFTLFLVLVGYITVMANVGHDILGNRTLAVALSAAIVLPLCFLDQAYLSFTSFLAVVVNVFLFMVMASLTPKHTDHICYLGLGPGNIAMFSAMMQAIVIQMCVLPMYGELEDRSPAKFNRIVATSFGILFMVFAAFAVVGYVTFGPHVGSNILEAIPHSPLGKAAKVGAAICVAAVYPIMEKTMVAPIRNLQTRSKRLLYILATFSIVALSMFAAMAGLTLGYLNVVTGALSCGVFVSLCPSAVGLFLLDCKCSRQVLLYTLLFFGTVMGLLGLVYTKNYSDDLHGHCFWKSWGPHHLKWQLVA
mmetsp:Transcript_40187/g.71321  ORF Transcript_40187/g.71321 Transcript_40187/m.71321 type:complete len:422 (+) Transcript_40187:40-1305(+)